MRPYYLKNEIGSEELDKDTKREIRDCIELLPFKGFISMASIERIKDLTHIPQSTFDYLEEYEGNAKEYLDYIILAIYGVEAAELEMRMHNTANKKKQIEWWVHNIIAAEKRRTKIDPSSANYEILADIRNRLLGLEEEIIILYYRPFDDKEGEKYTINQLAEKYNCSTKEIELILNSAVSKLEGIEIQGIPSNVPETKAVVDNEEILKMLRNMEED